MSRAESTARRKARKVKSRKSLNDMSARQERRRNKEIAAERRLQEKYEGCPYHGMTLDPRDNVAVHYAEGADKALRLHKWTNEGWPLWVLECEACDEFWMLYHVKVHP